MTNKNTKKSFTEKKKVPINIKSEILFHFIQYVFSDNETINRKGLNNLRRLVNAIDVSIYKNDKVAILAVKFLSKLLEGILDKYINDYELLKEYCDTELSPYKENLVDFWENDEYYEPMSNTDVQFVNEIIENNLTYMYLFRYSNSLETCLDNLNTSNGRNLKEINKSFKNVIGGLFKDIKNAEANSQYSALDFDINSDSLAEIVGKTIEQLKKPNNFLRTGIQKLNEMLNGGLENGRCYIFLGLPKHFKSGLLLLLAIWSCKYNTKAVTKDPTKKPAVLYLSNENSSMETLLRVFTGATGEKSKDMKNYSIKKVVTSIREEMTNNSPVNLLVKYRPNKSMSTLDIDGMIDDLETEGYEVICLVQDYIKRIRSSENNPDPRLEMGNVVNDLTVIAKTRNIPVVSASQLNREAMRVMEQNIQKGKADICKELNASHIGESALVLENTDVGVIINKEEDPTTKENFLSFKLIAQRGESSGVNYFAHPFLNAINLVEDADLAESHSIERIGTAIENFNPNEFRKKRMLNKTGKQVPSLNLNNKNNLDENDGNEIIEE